MYFLVFCLLLSGSFADIPISHNVAEDVLTETEKFPIMTIGDILEEEIANLRSSIDHNTDLLSVISSEVTRNTMNIEINSQSIEDNSNKVTNVTLTIQQSIEDVSTTITESLNEASTSLSDSIDDVSTQAEDNMNASKYIFLTFQFHTIYDIHIIFS